MISDSRVCRVGVFGKDIFGIPRLYFSQQRGKTEKVGIFVKIYFINFVPGNSVRNNCQDLKYFY